MDMQVTQKESPHKPSEAALPEVLPFYEQDSSTFSYIVIDPTTNCCAVVDSVLDFDFASGTIGHTHADQIVEVIEGRQLKVLYLLETHVHADHLSAAPYLQSKVGGQIGISKHIVIVQNEFGRLFNEGTEFQRDGSQFDLLFEDNESFEIGNMNCKALHTPGHTPACMTYLVGDSAFVGDTLFMPDAGTARADFPGGDAKTLYQSIQRVLSLPAETQMYMCHDYQPNGRNLEFKTTVAEQLENNIHVNQLISEDEFVSTRKARDVTLSMPRLIFPALQVNIRAGRMPAAENNGTTYLKVPIGGA